MSKGSEWLREERRKTLGDWAAFCRSCGFTLRWFEESETDMPTSCPHCSGELVCRCSACGSAFASAFAVVCETCGATLRENTLFGMRIRRGR